MSPFPMKSQSMKNIWHSDQAKMTAFHGEEERKEGRRKTKEKGKRKEVE